MTVLQNAHCLKIYVENIVIKCYLPSEFIMFTNIPVNTTLNIYDVIMSIVCIVCDK